MVWGCITRNGVSKVVVVDGNIDAVKYCNIIDKNIPLSVEQCFGDQHHPVIFQHDNASPHSAGYIMIYLQLRKHLRIRWPSQSPDLNPIKNIWGYIKRELNKTPPRNKSHLIRKVLKSGKMCLNFLKKDFTLQCQQELLQFLKIKDS